MNIDFKHFFIVDHRGRELVQMNGDVMFYFDIPLREICDQLLDVMEHFYQLCPKDEIGWYATETMKKFKPTTNRSYTLPEVWWKKDAPKKELRELMLKGGAEHHSIPNCGIYLRGAEPENRIFKKNSNYVRFLFPTEMLKTNHQAFIDFVVSACNKLPFVCGHGGYVIECNQYFPEDAQSAAFPLAMRFQAVDIATMSRGPWAVRGERIKNVGWLTLIGSDMLEKIGGLNGLSAMASNRLRFIETAHGVIVQAGEKPILGDVNRNEDLSAYIDAYRILAPLHDGIETLFAPFELPDGVDEDDATRRWLFRFSRKGN